MILKRIPNEDDLARVAFELSAIGARCIGANRKWPYRKMDKHELLALAAEMSRHDPRLFGILVEYFIKNWKEINPLTLREKYISMKTPEIFGVIAEFSKAAKLGTEAAYYFNYLTGGLKPVPTQFFFHELYRPGGTLANRATFSSLAEFKRWGFLSCERPIVDTISTPIGTLDSASRQNVLIKLLERKKTISISDYLKAVNNTISRQQALIDLKDCKSAVPVGKGRGSRWKLAA